MSWYKTGAVSVTQGSNAVIGTGTSFIANSRVGDAFRGPDGEWYEVTNIASDIALSISPNYQGGSISGGLYSLAPMQGYVKDSADALRAATKIIASGVADMTAQVVAATEAAESAERSKETATAQAGIATSAAETSTQDKNAASLSAQQSQSAAQASGLAAQRSESARDSIVQSEAAAAESARAAAASAEEAEIVTRGKAASGANSDITSLSGLTTPLSLSQGGTGGTAGIPLPNADANAESLRNGSNYLTPAVWVGSVFTGNNGRNFGFLTHACWSDNKYAWQTFNTLEVNPGRYFRIKYDGVWRSWVDISSIGGAEWGGITGSLASQLDLKTALDSKQGKPYVSPPQIITGGGTLNLTHGLGGKPSQYSYTVVCVTNDPDTGYVVGDEVQGATLGVYVSDTRARGVAIWNNDATTVRVKFGSEVATGVLAAIGKTSGNNVVLNNNNWRIIVKAYL